MDDKRERLRCPLCRRKAVVKDYMICYPSFGKHRNGHGETCEASGHSYDWAQHRAVFYGTLPLPPAADAPQGETK